MAWDTLDRAQIHHRAQSHTTYITNLKRVQSFCVPFCHKLHNLHLTHTPMKVITCCVLLEPNTNAHLRPQPDFLWKKKHE